MKKLLILSAFLVCTLANVYAQSDSSANKLFKINAAKKNPIYTIDGIRQGFFTDLSKSSLKVENIEAVKVLKSDDAIKLYGVEATGGAVLITTKTGKNNTSNLDLEQKLKSLNLEKSISTFRNTSLTPRIKIETDSIKSYSQSPIIFRGLNHSIDTSNEPVYVLNGDKVEKASINLLNPNTIASVTILKKGDEMKLYGSQALNGVVIITTKPVPKLSEKATDKN
ncbi:hypothetical protein GCM10022246_19170 [Pedobacter ginsengiterrae]|uniref:TonB-dependent receptor plug domain-containing protein n=1 Tax=Pedobacter ginsengiterrae TaxID=871696 RepID=A0ABP7PIW8_9SPHI